MIIDLASMGRTPRAFGFEVGPADIELESEDVKLTSSVSAIGEVAKDAVQTKAQGVIEADITIDCTRCLEPVAQKLSIPFEVNFVSDEKIDEGEDRELSSADLDTSVLTSDEIDMNEVVREQILLNLPEQIFCKEDCKGLCPKCGANRNLIDCKCADSGTDPRWAALKNLR